MSLIPTAWYSAFACVTWWTRTEGRTPFDYVSGAANPWLLQEIDDPFGRKATFAYNGSNWLNTITDAANNTNSFAYASSPAASGWLQSLTTPYGTTSFTYYQVMDPDSPTNYQERVTYVAEPEGVQQLFAYVHNTSGIVEATNASPTVPGVVFDNGTTGGTDNALHQRNSFHWDRKQTANLSSDVLYLPPAQHFHCHEHLPATTITRLECNTGSGGGLRFRHGNPLQQARPIARSGRWTDEGQWTWYGYTNNPPADMELTSQVGAIARLLPDGTANYTAYNYQLASRYFLGNPTPYVSNNVQTYSKPDGSVGVLTTWFHYTNNNIDLYSVSNSIGQSKGMGYNNSHEVTSITNALDQVSDANL